MVGATTGTGAVGARAATVAAGSRFLPSSAVCSRVGERHRKLADPRLRIRCGKLPTLHGTRQVVAAPRLQHGLGRARRRRRIEIERLRARLFTVHVDAGEDQWRAERLGLLDGRAPAFEERRIDERVAERREAHHVLVRQHAEEPELVVDAKLGGALHQLPVMPDVSHVVRVAGCRDHDARLPLLELRQRLDHDRVVLVLPELVGKIEKALRQSVFLEQRGTRSDGELRRPYGEAHDDSPAAARRIEALRVGARILAAQHQDAPGGHLCAVADLAPPPLPPRKHLRQVAVLEIRSPGERRDREAPAVELRGLEDHVDARVAEYSRRGRHVAERARPGEADAREPAVEHRGPDRRLREQRRELGNLLVRDVVADEEHGIDTAVGVATQHADQVQQVVVTAGPVAAADQREADAHRSVPGRLAEPVDVGLDPLRERDRRSEA